MAQLNVVSSTGGRGDILLGRTSRLGASAVHASGEAHASTNFYGVDVWNLQTSNPKSTVCVLVLQSNNKDWTACVWKGTETSEKHKQSIDKTNLRMEKKCSRGWTRTSTSVRRTRPARRICGEVERYFIGGRGNL